LSVNALVSEFLNNLAAREDRTKRDRVRLRQPNPTLHGRRPIDLLDSEEGLQEVEDVLTRIESGTYG
jgi:uncharacterized protein (DUF2384 family)